MNDRDKRRFLQAFNRLAVATRLPASEVDEAMPLIYFWGLEDLPIDLVEGSAHRLSKTQQWFPKLAEWRADAMIGWDPPAALPAAPPPEGPLCAEWRAAHARGEVWQP